MPHGFLLFAVLLGVFGGVCVLCLGFKKLLGYRFFQQQALSPRLDAKLRAYSLPMESRLG